MVWHSPWELSRGLKPRDKQTESVADSDRSESAEQAEMDYIDGKITAEKRDRIVRREPD